MPSLRRTASNPLVRSSPYSYSSSLSGAQATRGNGRRRSSGSDITSRRVLADIEWWKVTDGQCENGSGDFEEGRRIDDDDENNVAPGMTSSTTLFSLENGVDHLLLPAALWRSDDDSSSDVPTAEFAALSIAPRTPTRRARRAPQSTSSSLESTPEPAVLTIEGLNLGLCDMGMFDDHAAFIDFEPAAIPSPPRLARAHTFADVFSLEDDFSSFYPESPLPNLLSLPTFVN